MNAQPTRSLLGDLGVLVIRLAVAAVFLFHGSQKLFGAFDGPGMAGFIEGVEKMGMPMPVIGAWLAALAEFVGGIFLVAGTGMRAAIVPTIITMLVASLVVHGKAYSAQHNGMEYPLTLALVMIGLVLVGPGRFTIGSLAGSRAS